MKSNKLVSTLFLLFALGLAALSTAQGPTQDLLFLAEFDNHADWYDNAFKPDAMRRNKYCKEVSTQTAKIDNKSAWITLDKFEMAKMPEFAGDQEMAAIMKKYNVRHNEVYTLAPFNPANVKTEKINLFFIITAVDYDLWLNKAFNTDSDRRAMFCDETRTRVGKINDKQAMVMLYDFEVAKLGDFEKDKAVGQLMQKYDVRHKVMLATPLAK